MSQSTSSPNPEFSIAISYRETFKEDGKQSIMFRPQVNVLVDALYVDGDVHPLDKPVLVQVGQLAEFEVPPKYSKESVCGVYAAQIDMSGTTLSRCPIGGVMVGDLEPTPVKIAAESTSYAVFQPQSPTRRATCVKFKRFDIRLEDVQTPNVQRVLSNLFINDIQVGKRSVLFAQGGIPLAMAFRADAFAIRELIAPGVEFAISVTNKNKEPVAISGALIFEDLLETQPPIPKHMVQTNN